jgi:hypothetical protein
MDLLIYAGIPLAVIAIVFALVFMSGARGAKRYRPGRPYEFAPVWFLARPEADGPQAEQAKLTVGGARSELTTVDAATGVPGVTGGASDRW